MTEITDDREEFALQAAFGRSIRPVADDGFANRVVGRVRRQVWKRRVVLLTALAAGLVIALPALPAFLLMFSGGLAGIAARAEGTSALGDFQVLLQSLPLRETVEAASQSIANASAQISQVSQYQEAQMLVLACLLAVVSFVASRVLEH